MRQAPGVRQVNRCQVALLRCIPGNRWGSLLPLQRRDPSPSGDSRRRCSEDSDPTRGSDRSFLQALKGSAECLAVYKQKTEHVFGVVTRESNWIFSIDLLRGAHCLVILVQSKCLCPGRRHVNVNLVQGVICVRRKCHSLKPGSVLFLVNTKDVIWRQYVDRLEQGCVCVYIYISVIKELSLGHHHK